MHQIGPRLKDILGTLQRLRTCPSRLKKFLPMDPHYEQKLEKWYNMMLVKAHIFAVFFGITGEASIEERVVEDGVKKKSEGN